VLGSAYMWRFALGFALVACKDDATPRSVPPTPARGSAVSRERPSLPAPEDEPTGIAPQQVAAQFDAEPVDRLWKQNTEAKLRRQIANATIECHSTICRVTFAGSEADITTQTEQLAGAGAFTLTAPSKRADGTLELQAYARFSP